jgi:hypothetical protein
MANPGHKPGVLEAAVAAFNKTGSITKAAQELKLSPHTLDSQLESARRLGMNVLPRARDQMATPDAKGRIETDLENGVVFVGSDLHAWPGVPSTAHRAFVHLCKEHSPDIVIMNGDATDLPRVSRHPPPGWTRMPEVKDEIEVTAQMLGEIALAAGKARRYWPWGNHDQRFEVYLASRAAEVAGVFGTRLLDHFPDWEPCWSVFINNRPGGLVVKHRYKGGIHATHNNAVMSGRSICTGHLHSQKITPVTDYNGTRYGVDTGCMADIYGPQFEYLEDNPRNWRAGFAVFTFRNGDLQPPELVTVIEPGAVFFRGQVIDV